MPDIHIQRDHQLGLPAARKLAAEWTQQAEQKFDLACSYIEGHAQDDLTFKRAGVTGTLRVTEDQFVFDAQLGFLFGAFKDKIEAEILKNLDALLAGAAKPQVKKAAGRPKPA